MKKILRIIVAILVLAVVLIFYFRYYKVFGDGVKAGTLNYVVRKGYVFKTYEGELIQAGLQSKQPNSMQSNEFLFSVSDEAVAKRLEVASGHEVQVHYTEYIGTIPWRGYSKYVVDSIISIGAGK